MPISRHVWFYIWKVKNTTLALLPILKRQNVHVLLIITISHRFVHVVHLMRFETVLSLRIFFEYARLFGYLSASLFHFTISATSICSPMSFLHLVSSSLLHSNSHFLVCFFVKSTFYSDSNGKIFENPSFCWSCFHFSTPFFHFKRRPSVTCGR